jgi:hypothetical protein
MSSVKLAPKLTLAALGDSNPMRLRVLFDAFEDVGWRDPGTTALTLVRELERRDGAATPNTLARLVPSTFLARNGAKRAELAKLFTTLAAGP